MLGTPFVIITVTATLVGFDKSLVRASQSLGAGAITTFRRVQMPLIIPGIISVGLFAFITSFDEVVAVLFWLVQNDGRFRGKCGQAFASKSARQFLAVQPCW